MDLYKSAYGLVRLLPAAMQAIWELIKAGSLPGPQHAPHHLMNKPACAALPGQITSS